MRPELITFRVPNGVPVELEVERVDIDGPRATLTATASPGSWDLIENGLLFNLDGAALTDELPPMLGTTHPVTFSARLAPSLVDELGVDPMSALAAAAPSSPLLGTEAWFLTEATSEDGTSYGTHWALTEDLTSLIAPEEISVLVGPDEIVPGPLLRLALQFVEDAELPVEVLGATVAGGRYEADNGEVDIILHTREEVQQLLVYARMPDPVPVDRLDEVMLLVTNINPLLTTAWLELERTEGRVSARTAFNGRGVDVDDDTFAENVITVAVDTMDRFLPAIRSVAFDGIDVADLDAADALLGDED